MKILKNMWKFTDTDADISDSKLYKCMESIENGNKKEFKKLYSELSKGKYFSDFTNGKYRLMGYIFDFTPYLKRFLVRFKYDNNYTIIYALNKNNIYNNMYISKYNIIDILEDTRHKIEEV